MTRERALEIARALDAIEAFEAFMDEVDASIANAEDYGFFSPNFKLEMENLMQTEYLRLKNELEEL